ncbi:MAG: response regulator transcription factor [Spirochaetales bacterium]|nr:MAG: response regulator transcription factor [Spirochaetales bacterium]
MRQALIKAVVVSDREDGGAGLARLIEDTGLAQCSAVLSGAGGLEDMTFTEDEIIVLEVENPYVPASVYPARLLFIGNYTAADLARITSIPSPFGVLSPDPDLETAAAALTALNLGLTVMDRLMNGEPETENNARREASGENHLTEREVAVLNFFARGFSIRDIAGYLRISVNTVKYYTSSLYGKLGAANRAEAVKEGIRRGLIAI